MENFIQDNMILISGEHKQEIYNIISKSYVNRPVYFIKYCKEKAHAEDVLNGNLFIRNARAYKEIEEQTGERGTGDKNEMACRVPINVPFTITIGDQTFNIPIGEGCEPSFVDSRDLDMLVYCLTWVDFPKINDIDIYENDNDIKWQSLYKLDNLDLNEYKYCVVIYGVEQFCLDFEKYVKAKNGVCFGGMVEYSNNIQQKFEDFTKMSARRFFIKINILKIKVNLEL